MTEAIVIELLGHPRGKGRPRFRRLGNGATVTHPHPETAEYEGNLKHEAKVAMNGQAPLSGPVALHLDARFPVPTSWSKKRQRAALAGTIQPIVTPDLTNMACITDGLNGVVWKDDRQVVIASLEKRYSDRPGIKITVFPAEPIVFDQEEG
jgi:Holliday junction resolvase RusA-like endonuclease